MKKPSVVFLLSFHLIALTSYEQQVIPAKRIIIEGEIPPGYNKDNINIVTHRADAMTYSDLVPVPSEQKPVDRKVKWNIPASEPTRVTGAFVGDESLGYLAEPGDSVTVQYEGNTPVFSGRGAAKWKLLYEIRNISDSMDQTQERKSLSSRWKEVSSLEDYLNWNQFLNKKLQIILPIIEQHNNRLSAYAFKDIKTNFCLQIEERRMVKFTYLKVNGTRSEKNKYGLTNEDLCAIYDSTLTNSAVKYLRNESAHIHSLHYQLTMLRWDYYRSKNKFFLTKESDPLFFGTRKEDIFIVPYGLAKKKYKGLLREKLLSYIFWDLDGVMAEAGFTASVDSLLSDYYNQEGFMAYKEMVKKYEVKYRDKFRSAYAQPFSLTDKKGKSFSSDQLKGKLVVADLWYTGCAGCVQMTPALKKVMLTFRNDTNVVFISVSADKDKMIWQESVKKGLFTIPDGIHLYTNGEGIHHEMIKTYQINSFPSIFMIDFLGRIIPFDKFRQDPRRDSGKAMIDLIRKELALSKDGPYIFYHQPDTITSVIFSGAGTTKTAFQTKYNIPQNTSSITDKNVPFTIVLKQNLQTEPCVFNRPEQLFVLSDIEGNFNILKELLVNNGIIDDELNWRFGKGHLVFLGDMFDRGNQVTECLWLLYMLEEKAKSSGGYLHFVLGNHEIMNLSGDNRYASEKYISNARKLNKTTKELYGNDSELGKWLRTKNIVEKIGDLLFVHGGISPQVNRLNLSLMDINNTVRPLLDKVVGDKDNMKTKILMRGIQSPYWYRGYYDQVKDQTRKDIDSSLLLFDVSRIITGHTIIADTVSVLFNGKVFNTDTKHADGFSEALFINGKNYYRANKEGIRTFIFKEN